MTGFRRVVVRAGPDLDGVVSAYAASLRRVFILAAVSSALGFFTSPLLGGVDVRKKNEAGTGPAKI